VAEPQLSTESRRAPTRGSAPLIVAACNPADYLAADDHRRVERDGVAWLKSVLHAPSDGAAGSTSTIVALAMFGVSLWWFMEGHFHRFTFKHVLRHLAWLLAALEREDPKSIVIDDDGSILMRMARAVADARGLATTVRPAVRRRQRLRVSPELRWAALGMADVARRRLSRWTPPAATDGRTRVLVSSMRREEIVPDPHTGRRVTQDLMLAPVLRTLGSSAEFQTTFLYKFYARRLRAPKMPTLGSGRLSAWEAYVGAAERREIARHVADADRVRRRLWQSEAFRRLWVYRGVDLWPVVREPLEALWAWELRQGIRHLVLAQRVLRDVRPNVLIVASETSLDNKALIATARRAGIPVVAAQHGSIPPTDDYLVDFSADPRDFGAEVSKEWMFPDRFCISGEATRRTLVDQIGYAFPERLVVTGQSRFDPLFSPSRYFDRDRFCRAFGVDPTKPIVVIGTQTFHIAGNREQFARAVLGALRERSDLTVLIKPHVIEAPAFYRKLIRDLGLRAQVLPVNTSMQEVLFACDLLITFYSTIAVEAMVLGRPVVTVNLTGAPDPLPFAREGAALGVYREGDISGAVRRALEDTEVRARLADGVRRFLPKEIGAEDGRATERILALARALSDRA